MTGELTEDQIALRNLAAFARYADPRRMPPYPRHRHWALTWLSWHALRIPRQRPWPEP